jgi:tRNA pseudouridine38-40 synthase
MAQRFKITVAYDGRPFDGWQSQTAGNTVQDLLQDAASAIAKQEVLVHGAGRTDAGVHALGQVAHFDAPEGSSMAPGDWQRALHTKLPRTIRVVTVEEVAESFHCRYMAKRKTYRYEIDTSAIQSPLRVGLAWNVYYPIDEVVLREAVALFQGRRDFANLAAKRRGGKELRSTVRTIYRAEVTSRSGGFDLSFEGDGFLYKMVRMMVGAAVDAARGRASTKWIRSMLENPGETGKCSACAPADGLYLVGVDYSGAGSE